MCSIGAALSGVSLGMSVIGGVKQASAAKKQANQQAAAMDANAAQLEYTRQQKQADAQAALDAAVVKGRKIQEVGARDVATTVAGYSGMGVKVDSGSAVDAQLELQRRIAEDAKQAELEGERLKKAYEAQAAQIGVQAADQRQAAVNTRANGKAQSSAILFSTIGGAALKAGNWISSAKARGV